ncbi:hypothetical protein AB0H42_20110 [Nocardia sp. NPDC050799]|uniref:hypothetical protein n=1 Tax=Nocardia sp. NPDC050799 TaxID=3154842 RepID=UPI0033F1DDD8
MVLAAHDTAFAGTASHDTVLMGDSARRFRARCAAEGVALEYFVPPAASFPERLRGRDFRSPAEVFEPGTYG